MTRALVGLAVAAAFALLVAQWRSGSPIDVAQDAFAKALAAGSGCRDSADCLVLATPCPLGCAHAVAAVDHDRLLHRALKLAERHARATGGACAQDCLAPPPAVCIAGRCSFGGALPADPAQSRLQ